VLVLTAVTSFTIMAVLRLQFFLSHPADVTIDVEYPDSVIFPQVTVCNQDPFK
jgi:hypothetical protein